MTSGEQPPETVSERKETAMQISGSLFFMCLSV